MKDKLLEIKTLKNDNKKSLNNRKKMVIEKYVLLAYRKDKKKN